MSGSAVSAGRAFIEVFLKDKVTANLRGMTTRLRAMSGLIGRMGGGMLGVGVAAAGAFVAPLRAASDLQEIMSKFDTVFGANSAAVKGWGDAFAGEVGRSKQQIADFLAGSQDLFVPLGFDEAAATDLSKTITGLSIDLASFGNKSDSDALRDLHAALTGSGEVMKKYGVIVSEAAVKQELLSQGIKATDASEQQKVMARLAIIMRGTTAAQGDAIKTAGSWANQNKRIAGSITDISAAIGSVLIPVLSPLQTAVGDVLANADVWVKNNRLLVIGLAAAAGAVALSGVGLIGLAGALWGTSVAVSALATVSSVAGAVLGGLAGIARGVAGGVLLKRAAVIATSTATRIYSAALGVARVAMLGVSGAISVVRVGFKAAAVSVGLATTALRVSRSVWLALKSATLATGAAISGVRSISITTAGVMGVLSAAATSGSFAMGLLSGGLAAVQASAVGPLAPIALVAAGVAGLGALLYVNRASIFDFLGISVGSLKGTISDVWAEFGKFTQGVSQWFSGVVSQAAFAWQGITAAIAVGDLASAWEIAWSTMKIVALQTFMPLQLAWSEFKTLGAFVLGELKTGWTAVMEGITAAIQPLQATWTKFMGSVSSANSAVAPLAVTWNQFTTGMVSAFDGAIVAIRQAWNSASTSIAQIMFSVIGKIQAALDRMAQFDPTGLAERLRGMLDIDADGINKMLEEDKKRFNSGLENRKQARDNERATGMAQRETERDDRIQELQDAHRKALQDLEKARADAMTKSLAAKAKQDAEVAEMPKGEDHEFDLGKLFEGVKSQMADLTTRSSTASTAQMQGTFSSVAAVFMAQAGGSQSPEERTAKLMEEAVKQSAKIVMNTSKMERDLAYMGTVG